MIMKKNTPLTAEEIKRKERVRTRLFVILVVFDVLLVGYLIYEMVSIFMMRKG